MLSIQDGFSSYIISCTNIDLPIITTLIMDSVRFVIHNWEEGERNEEQEESWYPLSNFISCSE